MCCDLPLGEPSWPVCPGEKGSGNKSKQREGQDGEEAENVRRHRPPKQAVWSFVPVLHKVFLQRQSWELGQEARELWKPRLPPVQIGLSVSPNSDLDPHCTEVKFNGAHK